MEYINIYIYILIGEKLTVIIFRWHNVNLNWNLDILSIIDTELSLFINIVDYIMTAI